MSDVTQLLSAVDAGDPKAADQLFAHDDQPVLVRVGWRGAEIDLVAAIDGFYRTGSERAACA